MGYSVKYAGIELSDYFKVLNIKRTLLPPRQNFTKEIPSIHGSLYTGYKYEPKSIVLSCAFTSEGDFDYTEKLKDMSFILDVKEPSKLILGDNPTCYYYAVIDGEVDIEKLFNTGSFDLNFICYDPFGYSVNDELFLGNNKKIITVDNGGSIEAFPKTSIEFSKEAYFLQCTNHLGETVLVGTPPGVEIPKAPFDPIVLKDNCSSVTNWNTVGNIIDAGREVNGSIIINAGGYAFTVGATQGGSSDKWYGGASRRNLGQNLDDFKVEVKLEHNSKGDLKGIGAGTVPPITTPPPTNPAPVWVDYQVKADPLLRIRAGRGTNHAQIGSYSNGANVKISDISGGWGYVGKVNGKDGYISMNYVVLKTTSSSSGSSGSYKVTAKSGLSVRSGRGSNYSRVTAINWGDVVSVSEISSGWGKTTYKGKTGYIAMQYTSKVGSSRNNNLFNTDTEEPSAENKLGIIEIYGYDQNGNKLFKFKMCDSQKWYEYSEPEVEFGSKLVLDDNKKCPSPKTTEIKTDGEKTVIKDTHSGTYGDWNDMIGWFTLERRTINGSQQWFAKVEKLDSAGSVIRTIQTQTLTGDYPKGALNNIVVFMGQYNHEPIVDVMNVSEIYVTNLGNPPKPEEIQPLFRQGDELIIDSSKQKIYKNGRLFMNNLDIGSQFFGVPVGSSQYVLKSDDENIDVASAIQLRWL